MAHLAGQNLKVMSRDIFCALRAHIHTTRVGPVAGPSVSVAVPWYTSPNSRSLMNLRGGEGNGGEGRGGEGRGGEGRGGEGRGGEGRGGEGRGGEGRGGEGRGGEGRGGEGREGEGREGEGRGGEGRGGGLTHSLLASA